METRQLLEQDVERLAALYSRVFNEAPWNDGWTMAGARERLQRFMSNPDSLGVVAVEGDEIWGFAVGVCERWVKGEHFHLKEMCTAPERQRQGVGSTVLAALSARLRERGVTAIYLQTANDSGADLFYRKRGFAVIGLQTLLRSEPSV